MLQYVFMSSGKSRFVTVSSKQSHFILSELSAGSSYIISVATIKGGAQSVELTSVITTGTVSDKLTFIG